MVDVSTNRNRMKIYVTGICHKVNKQEPSIAIHEVYNTLFGWEERSTL
jgi:Fe2+ or Zn2+ uptake regulation protein